jgi:hypothetical protein
MAISQAWHRFFSGEQVQVSTQTDPAKWQYRRPGTAFSLVDTLKSQLKLTTLESEDFIGAERHSYPRICKLA